MQSDLSHDEFHQKLRNDVFPGHWKSPTPAPLYDLVVVGGGPGGMTAAVIARMQNAKVALVEKEHLGGECLSMGCIPSKALLRSSRVAAEVRNAAEYGIEIPKGWKVNFPAVMERVRRLQSTISPHDSPDHMNKLGIDVFFGRGHFLDSETLQVADKKLRFKRAIIATGTQPIIPPIPGLVEAGFLTNQNVFLLTSLPSRLAVIGAGPIGCELSQAFVRFGSQVTLITRGPRILPRDDLGAAERLRKVMEKEGLQILLQTQVKRIEKKGKEKILHLDNSKTLIVDEVLIAIGRAPVVEGLNLDKAGVIYDHKKGIAASDTLETSNPKIYVVGDVGSEYKFTHVSKELAKLAVHNALNDANEKRSSLIIPWCTYTDPEIAHIGLQNVPTHKTQLIEFKDIDRAVVDGETTGFVKIHTKEGSDQIVGATIVARHAGDMISEIAVAMASNKAAAAIAQAIHPFPTQAEAIRAAAVAIVNTMSKKSDVSHKRAAS